MRSVRRILAACSVAACVLPSGAGSSAAAGYVDGISDQSLPAWDGSFAASPFAEHVRGLWAGGLRTQISLARYVLQWNALTEAAGPPSAHGNYRERFEAWLKDIRSVELTPVVALTSYNGVYPESPGEYGLRLKEILDRAAVVGEPIAYIEAWNEPNNQGHESPAKAAELANAANAVCEAAHGCRVIAGDFEDSSAVAGFERAYEASLNFPAELWGVHPYVSVKTHTDANLLSFRANLPNHGVGEQIWFTEIGAFYCKAGEVLGEGRQASDASYLVHTLIGDPALAPAHVFYYGLLFRDHAPAPCTRGGGDDTELYGPSDEPRAAASIVLRPANLGEQLLPGLSLGADLGAFGWAIGGQPP
jgi:hypothetical protein